MLRELSVTTSETREASFPDDLAVLREIFQEYADSLGCVAVRPMGEGACEMKRLYVRAQGRGQGLGRRLAEAICVAARVAGYQRIRLDTLATMTTAQDIYLAMGFQPIPAYVFNPIEGVRYLEFELAAWHLAD